MGVVLKNQKFEVKCQTDSNQQKPHQQTARHETTLTQRLRRPSRSFKVEEKRLSQRVQPKPLKTTRQKAPQKPDCWDQDAAFVICFKSYKPTIFQKIRIKTRQRCVRDTLNNYYKKMIENFFATIQILVKTVENRFLLVYCSIMTLLLILFQK